MRKLEKSERHGSERNSFLACSFSAECEVRSDEANAYFLSSLLSAVHRISRTNLSIWNVENEKYLRVDEPKSNWNKDTEEHIHLTWVAILFLN